MDTDTLTSASTSPVGARRHAWLALAVALIVIVAVAAVFFAPLFRERVSSSTPLDAELLRSLPRMNAKPPFAGSQQCRECHPAEFASWHASFHRQMTQVARPETVLGPYDGTVVRHAGQAHRVVRKGEELWVETWSENLPLPEGEGTLTARRVVMTTGAHHLQAYWASDGHGNRLQELPVMYIRDSRPGKGRWAPLEASYISPLPPGAEDMVHWNTDCILCHATGGVPRLETSGDLNSTVSELGITCESCHGPGREHVDLQRSALSGVAVGERQAIVNPAKLHPERAAQVCGHCHSAAVFASQDLLEEFLMSGSPYRPGDDLLQTRIALLPARLTSEQNDANRKVNPFYEGSYWPDGMIRVTGREYNGLVESTCYQKGGMTCISCHSMHQSDPDDQLAAVGRGNQACYQCHESYRDNLAAHTYHLSESSGSECYNCHMPHTTYGLFSAIRSHKITSPSVADTLATGRPTACNLCHLDQTLMWTNRHLADWYGQHEQELTEEQKSLSESAVLLLKGDAVQRVLFAWAAGWQPAQAASGSDWLAPVLAPLLDDPSPVIRQVTSRSLASIRPGYALDYDFVAPRDDRKAAREQVLAAWRQLPRVQRQKLPARVFVTSGGEADVESIERLLSQRDDRGVLITE